MNNEEIRKKIAMLEKSNDSKNLFLAMELIVELGDEELLKDFIEKYKNQLYRFDPIKFIGTHVDFYMQKEDFFNALDILSFYQNEPFINLTTDDFMKELKEEIIKLMKPNKNKYDILNAEKDLYSENEECLLRAISYLSKCNARENLLLFENALKSNILYRYKILLQFIVIEQAIDQEFIVKQDDENCFTFNPSKTLLPFDRQEYKLLVKYLNSLNESPSIIKTALELLNTIEVRIFPKSILQEDITRENIGEIFIYLAKDYLMEKPNIEDLVFNTGLSEEELNKIIASINEKLM